VYTLQIVLQWRPANLNETTLGFFAAQMQSPKNFNLAMTSRHSLIIIICGISP